MSDVTVSGADDHLVAKRGDGDPERVPHAGRRISVRLQQLAGHSVEQVGGPTTLLAQIVPAIVPARPDQCIVTDRRDGEPELLAFERRRAGKRVEQFTGGTVEQKGGSRTVDARIVPSGGDEHVVADRGNRSPEPAGIAVGPLRRIDELLQQVPSPAVEKVDGAQAVGTRFVVPGSDEHIVAHGRHGVPELGVLGRCGAEVRLQELARFAVEQVSGAGVFGGPIVEPRTDQHIVPDSGNGAPELIVDIGRRAQERSLKLAGLAVEQIDRAGVFGRRIVERSADEHLLAQPGDSAAELVSCRRIGTLQDVQQLAARAVKQIGGPGVRRARDVVVMATDHHVVVNRRDKAAELAPLVRGRILERLLRRVGTADPLQRDGPVGQPRLAVAGQAVPVEVIEDRTTHHALTGQQRPLFQRLDLQMPF